jgi:hypothetical protein
MPSCEKCWGDAYTRSVMSGQEQADIYAELLLVRNCTPEEQAGDEATRCPTCKRMTIHAVTGECMACTEPT